MKRNYIKSILISFLMIVVFSSSSFSGIFNDSLGQCFVRSATLELVE